MMKWKHQIKIGAFLIMMLTLLTYMGASAFAEFGFAPPPANDMSRSFLNQIFGGLLDGGQDAFGGSIKSFNAAVLVVGGVLAAYTIFSATLGTAHDGEMLGKKFSSVWIPIRYTMGTALVLPVLSGGYCIMQGIVMWLIMQGVSIANGIWSEYMANPPSLVAMMGKAPPLELVQLAENVYLMQVCVQGNRSLGETGSSWGNMFGIGSTGTDWEAKRNFAGNWTFGFNNAISSYSCGTLGSPGPTAFYNSNTSEDNTISNRRESKEFTIPSIDTLKNVFVSPSYAPILNAHKSATDTLVASMGSLASTYVGATEAPPSDAYNSIVEAAREYQKSIYDAAIPLLEQDNNIEEASTQNGWFIAGAWITQIIIHQNKLNSSLTNYPEIKNLRIGTDDDDKVEPFSEQVNRALMVISPNNTLANDFIVSSTTPEKKKNGGKDTAPSMGGYVGEFLASMITGLDIEAIKDDKRHPLIIMSSVGNSILNSILISAVLVAGSAMLAAATGFAGMPVIAGLLVKYGTFALPIAGFIGIGATLAYVIPNLPFILWIGIIIGWTVMCVEAILAAPLWAVMHLHPNGDDMTGKGANGYMLVLGLLLRPALIIFGLIAAITLSGLFGQLVNAIFFSTFAMNQGDASLGFFAIIFGTGLYAAIMMTVIKQCFNLMHMIPDQLMRWIGGGQEQLGQYAGASSDAITKGGMIGGMAAGLVTTDVMKASQGGASGYLDKIREKGQAAGNISAEKSKVMDNLGSSAGDVMNAINENHGGGLSSEGSLNNPIAAMNSLEAVKQKSEFQALSKSFGDAGTRNSFNQAMSANLKSGQSFNDARDAALSHTIGKHFGGGEPGSEQYNQAVGFAQKLSGGEFGTWSGDTNNISRTIQAMEDVQHIGGASGENFNESAGQQTLSGIMTNTITEHAKDPTSNIRNIFAKERNNLVQIKGDDGTL